MRPEGDIGAVVLAAGASRRFGEANKLLARVGERTLIGCVVDAIAAAGIGDIVVVTGWDRVATQSAASDPRVRIVHNPRWETGMGSSIAVGIEALPATTAGAFIVPADMPLLTPRVIATLMSAFTEGGSTHIVFPTTASGEQRNPVLWPRSHFSALLALPPEKGAKALLQLVAAQCLAVMVDEDALGDIDTSADLDALRKRGAD